MSTVCTNNLIENGKKNKEFITNTTANDINFQFLAEKQMRYNLYNNSNISTSASPVFFKELKEIRSSDSCEKIIQIVKHHKSNSPIVYTVAIKRCGQLRNVNACEQIMDILNEKNVIANTIVYNALFYAFSRNDRPWLCDPHFLKMEELNIVPNAALVCSWMYAYQRRINQSVVDRIWNKTMVKYGIKPDVALCNQMLIIDCYHGKYENIEKWVEIIIENGDKPLHCTIGALIKAYAQSKQIKKMEEVKATAMEKYGIAMKPIHYISLMAGYLKVDSPEMALEMHDECIVNYGQLNDTKLQNMKHVALLQLLKQETDQLKCDSLYANVMESTVHQKEVKQAHFVLGQIKLQASIHYYGYDCNSPLLIETFQQLCHAYALGYWSKHWNTNEWIIDLHSFDYFSAEFILHYILNYESKDILDLKRILILCGQRKHVCESKQDRIGLMGFLQQKLKLYEPTIDTREIDKVFLQLRKKHVHHYCKREK